MSNESEGRLRRALEAEIETEQRMYDECRRKMVGGEHEHAYCLNVLRYIVRAVPPTPPTDAASSR